MADTEPERLIAYDSTKPKLIPASAQAIFPYADGKYAWSHKLFPRARYRYITVFGDPKADIADVEPGCIWPPSAVRPWALERRSHDLDATVYCDKDTVPAVKMALEGVEWHLGLATRGQPAITEYLGIPLRFDQYTDQSGAFDESLVYEPEWLNYP